MNDAGRARWRRIVAGLDELAEYNRMRQRMKAEAALARMRGRAALPKITFPSPEFAAECARIEEARSEKDQVNETASVATAQKPADAAGGGLQPAPQPAPPPPAAAVPLPIAARQGGSKTDIGARFRELIEETDPEPVPVPPIERTRELNRRIAQALRDRPHRKPVAIPASRLLPAPSRDECRRCGIPGTKGCDHQLPYEDPLVRPTATLHEDR